MAEKVEEIIQVAGLKLRLQRVADLNPLIDQAQHEDELPFWAELWPAGVGLIEAMAGEDLRGKRVLDLGCGLGTSGIGAALLGAEVTFSDFQAQALSMAKENVQLNGVVGRFVQADWRDFPELGPFDWVIGSDLLYEPKVHRDLLDVLSQTLAPGGIALLSDPGRDWAKDFQHLLKEAGWIVTVKKQGKIDVYTCQRS